MKYFSGTEISGGSAIISMTFEFEEKQNIVQDKKLTK